MSASGPVQQLVIHHVGELRATLGGHRFLECDSHLGRVLVRGTATNMRNIQSLRQNPLRCDVVTLGHPCKLGEHVWYVTEDTDLYFLVH